MVARNAIVVVGFLILLGIALTSNKPVAPKDSQIDPVFDIKTVCAITPDRQAEQSCRVFNNISP